jgi:hypothetical protein
VPVAYLFRRADGRLEIREAVATPQGPRARTLAAYRGALSPEILERAEARATRPFDRAALLARARALRVPAPARRGDADARELLARLRVGAAIDPTLAALLRDALAPAAAAALPLELAEVAEWVGVDDARRGEALRGLLRVSDRAVRGREPVRKPAHRSFPRFRSVRARPGR